MILCRLYGDILQENSCEHELQQIENNMDVIIQDTSPEKINMNIVAKLKENVIKMVSGIREVISSQLPELKANIEKAIQVNAANPNAVITLSICIPNVLENFVDNLTNVYKALSESDKIKTGSDLTKCILTQLKGTANMTPDDMADYIKRTDSQGVNGAISYSDMGNHYENLSSKYNMIVVLLENIENYINTASSENKLQESTVSIMHISLSYVTALISICSLASTCMTNAIDSVVQPVAGISQTDNEAINECNLFIESVLRDSNESYNVLTEGVIGDIGKKIMATIKELLERFKNLFKTNISTRIETTISRLEAINAPDDITLTGQWTLPYTLIGLAVEGVIASLGLTISQNKTYEEFCQLFVGNDDLAEGMRKKFNKDKIVTSITSKHIPSYISDLKSNSTFADCTRLERYILGEISELIRDDDTTQANMLTKIFRQFTATWISMLNAEITAYNKIATDLEKASKKSKLNIQESAITDSLLEGAMEDVNDFCYILTEGVIDDLGKKIWTMIKEFFAKFKDLFKTKIQKQITRNLTRLHAIEGPVKIQVSPDMNLVSFDIDYMSERFITTIKDTITRNGGTFATFNKTFVNNDSLEIGMTDKFLKTYVYSQINDKVINDCTKLMEELDGFKTADRVEKEILNQVSHLLGKNDSERANQLTRIVRQYTNQLVTMIQKEVGSCFQVILEVEDNLTGKQSSVDGFTPNEFKPNEFKPNTDNKSSDSSDTLNDSIAELELSIKNIMASMNKPGVGEATQGVFRNQIEKKKAKIAKLKQIKNDNPKSTKEADEAANKRRSNFGVVGKK
jgi:hypothetical protein